MTTTETTTQSNGTNTKQTEMWKGSDSGLPAVQAQADDVHLVPLDSIKVDDKKNVRQTSGLSDEEIEELASQIRTQGLLTPLTVDQNGNLWAGFRRFRALSLIHKGNPHALVKVTVRPIEETFQGLLLNIGENTGRKNLNDYELGKRLFELDDPDGKYAVKRSMIVRQTGMSKSAVAALISTYAKATPATKKVWEASHRGEVIDAKGNPVVLPAARLADWVKKEPKEQALRIEAYLDGDKPVIAKEAAEAVASADRENAKEEAHHKGKKSHKKDEEEVLRPPTKAEIKAELQRLDDKDKKHEGLDERDMGRYQMVRWVLGIVSRPH